jgi:hypothetical protein
MSVGVGSPSTLHLGFPVGHSLPCDHKIFSTRFFQYHNTLSCSALKCQIVILLFKVDLASKMVDYQIFGLILCQNKKYSTMLTNHVSTQHP